LWVFVVLAFQNRILSALPDREQAVVRPDLERVTLRGRDILYPADEPLAFVYFPQGAVLSVLTVMQNGAAVEIGTFGLEGLSGAQLILGGDRAPSQMICQIPGETLRMPVDRFLYHLKTAPTFQRIVRRYTEALFNFMGQSIACNRLHTVDERCARWLLMSHDRVGGDQFDLTQEFLAIMLGVHRPGVSIAAASLQQAGFIRYIRGHVEIRDRKGLESAACECYKITADQFARSLHEAVGRDDPVEFLAY
jgi:CRP-like cAMP-binding protein